MALVSLFVGSAIQGKVKGWMFYLLVNNSLFSSSGTTKHSDPEKFAIDKGISCLKKNYRNLIDAGTKVRVHTCYEHDIDLPFYEKVNNVHYLQTNADIYAMEIAKHG